MVARKTVEAAPEATEAVDATPVDESLNIYQIINRISVEAGPLAQVKESTAIPFAFRGVDATVKHLAPYLKKYGVLTVPRVVEHDLFGRVVGNKYLTEVRVLVEWRFYGPDGTYITATTFGQAQDFADRAAAQAQSVAYRVALLQVFKLPTGEKEPEVRGEEVIAETEKEEARVAAAPQPKVKTPSPVEAMKAEIELLLAGQGVEGLEAIGKAGNEFFDSKPGWTKSLPALTKWRDALANGEIK